MNLFLNLPPWPKPHKMLVFVTAFDRLLLRKLNIERRSFIRIFITEVDFNKRTVTTHSYSLL